LPVFGNPVLLLLLVKRDPNLLVALWALRSVVESADSPLLYQLAAPFAFWRPCHALSLALVWEAASLLFDADGIMLLAAHIEPMIMDARSAKDVARWGYYAAFVVAALTALYSLLSLAGLHHSALVDAVLFVIIGIGIRKMSRFAAIAGLLLYLSEVAWRFQYFGVKSLAPLTLLWTGVLIFCFVQGIRGTYAYRRIFQTKPEPLDASG
jgi:hypothetical protein